MCQSDNHTTLSSAKSLSVRTSVAKCISNSADLGEQESGPGRGQEQGQEREEGVDAAKAGRVKKNTCTVKYLNECTGWTISNLSF